MHARHGTDKTGTALRPGTAGTARADNVAWHGTAWHGRAWHGMYAMCGRAQNTPFLMPDEEKVTFSLFSHVKKRKLEFR